jgi:uncharacterized protein (TIGR00369 family)
VPSTAQDEPDRVRPPAGFTPLDTEIPFLELVGEIYVHEREPARFRIFAQEKHANHRGTVMGGMLATFVDFALGRAIAADADDGKERATVSLTIDYLAAAPTGGWIEARTTVDRIGGTLAFADCSLRADEREIVRARSVWASLE